MFPRMPKLIPDLADMPMSLGDHLHERRKRIITPVIALIVFFIAAFVFQAELKLMLVKPLQWAIAIVGPENAAKAGMVAAGGSKVVYGIDIGAYTLMLINKVPADPARLLHSFELGESTMLSMSVSFDAAIVLTIPIIIYQLWMFVAVGLKQQERMLGFLFIPAGVIFFYIGGIAGYFVGLPYFFAWLIEWQANDPTAVSQLGQSLYHEIFVTMTICFGLIMDIPWLVMVLVRVGLVSVEQFSKWRRVVIFANVVLAAMITPTADIGSLAAIFIPMQLLFELGLFAARFLRPIKRKDDDHHDDSYELPRG